MDLSRLMGMGGGGGAGMGGPTGDEGQTDNSEQVLISSLALLKVRARSSVRSLAQTSGRCSSTVAPVSRSRSWA